MKPDHPLLDSFLRQYRANHGTESVQVTASGALIPLKAARAWTATLDCGKQLSRIGKHVIKGIKVRASRRQTH